MPSSAPQCKLGKKFTFKELLSINGVKRLDEEFLSFIVQKDLKMHLWLLNYRQGEVTDPVKTSENLITCAIYLEDFLADLFNISQTVQARKFTAIAHNPIAAFKKYFVMRRAKKELSRVEAFPSLNQLNDWLDNALLNFSLQTDDRELAIALLGIHYLKEPDLYAVEIEKMVQWCTRILAAKLSPANWQIFKIREQLDFAHLVETEELDALKKTSPARKWRQRDGFQLTDKRMDAREVQDEINYCIYCHDHKGDFCSKGFPVKKNDPSLGFKKNSLNVELIGCPLEEKISEMQLLKRDGYSIAALAMVMVDNPMCPATGHRICNDCMKACIYQKQVPVNIPQIETRVLTDVLELPWGVEIYDLLTRFNPLRQKQWLAKPYNGLKILIAGMGPAGFTLAHHLLQEGCAVVGFDGLKIEPLPTELIHQPIYRFSDLKESLDERLMAGFGGVAEYGITVRWDKNFLKLIYLSLMRRPYFQVFGGVRFGGTIMVEDAWEMGFDHLAVAVGAGLPTALSISGSMAPGMRQANDFLMALQLGNAAKADSLTNLQIRLPAIVIGGGLTGVDTATELQAYYIRLVEKVLYRYEQLTYRYGENYWQALLNDADRTILNEYLHHGHLVRRERERAKLNGSAPNFIKLVHDWGGVTIVYRRAMQDSPAYVNNHEELQKALHEGIFYLEGLKPNTVELDQFGHIESLTCLKRIRNEQNKWITTQESISLPARSIMVATGTRPNTAYEFEHRGTFNRSNFQYHHYEDENGILTEVKAPLNCKDPQFGPFTSYQENQKRVSLIGDTHPVFHGSVVKAIAGGFRTYPKVMNILKNQLENKNIYDYHHFAQYIKNQFSARVELLIRKTKNILELTIFAPLALKHFQPGQFYRLQNFETLAHRANDTLLQMEPLALVPAEVDRNSHTITFIVDEKSASAKLCATLKHGDQVTLMGPTGVRAKLPTSGETILIIGHAASLPFIRCYGTELKRRGNRVIYFGQFENSDEVYCQEKIEAATDFIIWQYKQGEALQKNRSTDLISFENNVLHGLLQYIEKQKLEKNYPIPIMDVDRIFLIGDTCLLRSFQHEHKNLFKKIFVKKPKIYGSVHANMQCMLKGVCAQCLQWQLDPETGKRHKAVFACSWQYQPLEKIDINHLNERQKQNSLLETLNKLWIDNIFLQNAIERI